jgi:hypothetical protein
MLVPAKLPIPKIKIKSVALLSREDKIIVGTKDFFIETEDSLETHHTSTDIP